MHQCDFMWQKINLILFVRKNIRCGIFKKNIKMYFHNTYFYGMWIKSQYIHHKESIFFIIHPPPLTLIFGLKRFDISFIFVRDFTLCKRKSSMMRKKIIFFILAMKTIYHTECFVNVYSINEHWFQIQYFYHL